MSQNISIIDFLVHGGHQYEFFKNKATFYCAKTDGTAPNPKELGRPKNPNVRYVRLVDIINYRFNLYIYRQGVKERFYDEIIKRNKDIRGIAVIQTYRPFTISKNVSAIVWNSKFVMDQFYKNFPDKKHFYIPHGFDPNEFRNLNLEIIPKILSSFSLFKQRGDLLGFANWDWVSQKIGGIDLMGHGNEEIKTSIGSHELSGIINKYNLYSAYLNTTTQSAMPRSRGEALMCGMPVITTKNYDIEKYLIGGESCLFADTKEDMLTSCNRILRDPSLAKNLGLAGREAAIKYFGIETYLKRWQEVFSEVLR